jgi:hypothetical protein
MTLTDALKIADQAKPIRRQPLDKLHSTSIAAATDALTKRFDAIGGTVGDMQKRIDQAAADVEFIQNFVPGQPSRRMQS